MSLTLVAFGVGCTPSQVQEQKLQDGSLLLTCHLTMDACIRKLQERCPNERFRIIDGVSETRVNDVPPFERAYHTSRVHARCSNDGADPLLSFQSETPASKAAAPAPKPLCIPGETRVCVGPGGCQGGQACLPSASGFSSCDCGNATPAPAEPPASTPSATPDAPLPSP